ncbi:hypothetical protein CSUI_005143 [Cystoisospora suis]|uniref:Uncharacterized protein n=1 Tax=Cystoisospora suis TaxID=483139 RepID=A0A2C6K7Z3_9APIC|nr:hypothetical protein CSUI_005143 [Cystoisospora suis]
MPLKLFSSVFLPALSSFSLSSSLSQVDFSLLLPLFRGFPLSAFFLLLHCLHLSSSLPSLSSS